MSLEIKRSPINELYFSSQAPRTEQFNVFPPSWTEREIFAFHEGRQHITRILHREVMPPHVLSLTIRVRWKSPVLLVYRV